MTEQEQLIQEITVLVAENLERLKENPYQVPVGVSARHLHLTGEHIELLFGRGYQLTPMKSLSQPGQFACEEQIELIGSKGSIGKVRILGPKRPRSQVEIAQADCRVLGITAPVRTSGELDGTPGIVLKGPKGEVSLNEGVIIADRHIHMTPADARWFGVSHKERVNVLIDGPKGGILSQVIIRISESSRLELHVDTDDSNAFQMKQGQWLTVRKRDN